MNFDRSLIFAYLEEDNIQRAYFRVRPLLSLEGDIRQEALQLWPNEGGLRIVPDRNEQHTFKTRMRTLGAYCVIDLRNKPPEAGKIRTNKNFKPERGEVNQYILYSDTVHELPAHTFYQLLDGEAADYVSLANQAVTPLFYIRHNDTLYGPVTKASPELPTLAQESEGILFTIPCPDGIERLILCIEQHAEAMQEPAASETTVAEHTASEDNETVNAIIPEDAGTVSDAPSSESVETESIPIGETLHILSEKNSHEETLQQLDQPVSSGANLLRQSDEIAPFQPAPASNELLIGTPLVRTPLHVSVQQTKNRTQEIVSNQWNVGKYEPPAQNLPTGLPMRAVKNPVESACASLREAWNATSAHEQLTDCILSLDGIRSQLEAKLCAGSSGTMLQRVLRQRLQDLEAERLTALCELDKARRDTDAYKQELLNSIAGRIQRETKQFEEANATAKSQADTLRKELNALTLQRDALLAKIHEIQSASLPEAVAKLVAEAQMAAPVSGAPLHMSPVSGTDATPEKLIGLLIDTCAASGIQLDRNTAIALLVCFAICPRIGFACPTPAALSTLIKNVMDGFGWQNSFAQQYAAEQRPLIGIKPVNSTPAILLTSLPNYAPLTGATKLLMNRNTAGLLRNAAYDVSQWPVWMLPSLPYVDALEIPSAASISAKAVCAIAEGASVANRELDDVLMPILKAAIPLSGSARKELYRFVSICAGLMEGGLSVAADWGIMLWIIPALERGSKQYAQVKSLLDEYPLSLARL